MEGRRIVVRTGGLGDLILFYPVLDELCSRHGGGLTLITSSGLVSVVYRYSPLLEETLLIKSRKLPKFLNRSLRAINGLASAGVECLYNFDGRTAKVGTFSQLENAADLLMDSDCLPRRGLHEHESDGRLRMISEAPEEARVTRPGYSGEADPILPVTEEEMQECEEWLGTLSGKGRKRVLLQAGNKKTMRRGRADRGTNRKYWSEANWARVIDGIRMEEDALILLCGAPSEYELLEAIRKECGSPEGVLNLARELPVRRLMALGRMPGSYYVGVDTGPAHLVAAMGCPCCILYGPASMVNYLPLSWGQLILPLEHLQPDEELHKKWITPDIGLISVEEVVSAATKLLVEGAHPTDPRFLEETVLTGARAGGG